MVIRTAFALGGLGRERARRGGRGPSEQLENVDGGSPPRLSKFKRYQARGAVEAATLTRKGNAKGRTAGSKTERQGGPGGWGGDRILGFCQLLRMIQQAGFW